MFINFHLFINCTFYIIYNTVVESIVESNLRNDTKKLQLENSNQLQAKKPLMQESTQK